MSKDDEQKIVNNRVLSKAERQELYNAGKDLVYPFKDDKAAVDADVIFDKISDGFTEHLSSPSQIARLKQVHRTIFDVGYAAGREAERREIVGVIEAIPWQGWEGTREAIIRRITEGESK